MDREQARQEIRRRISCTEYLEKSKSGLYCCPYCGSGTGAHSTGAVKYYPDTNTWNCFSCRKSGDVIDLFQNRTGTDYNTALTTLAGEIGVTIDQTAPEYHREPQEAPQELFSRSASEHMENSQKQAQTVTEPQADFTAYYKMCRQRITDPAPAAYLAARGISTETAAAYWIGFDPAADPAQSGHTSPRIIIPTSSGHYIGRSIDQTTPKQFCKLNNKGGHPAIFNHRALYAQDAQEIFVVEGAFDALSLLEIGATAVALNSTANADNLVKELQEHRTEATLILCMDNDEAGKRATEALRSGLQRINISYVTADITGGAKDANEALTANRAAFIEAVETAKHQTAMKPDNTSYYIDKLMTSEIEKFKSEVKTGFENLDEQTGGLYGGLYVIAAISSLGKTTFAAQMADQIAGAGHDVLFFSLEQSRLELVSKSLARITAQNNMETAVTSLSIRKGYLPRQVLEAAKQYQDANGDRVSVIEGNFACNISFIGNYIRQYVSRTGTRPVVFIDYLQILQPAEDSSGRKQSTKETVDSTITELKRISRELDLTVFVVSSVNRSNYLTPIDFESLKESGGIEYTADCIWGLQLQCLNEPIFDKANNIKERRARIREAKAENPRKIELCCLKNRYGIANFSCYFKYYPANDLYTICGEDELDFEPEQPQKRARRKL